MRDGSFLLRAAGKSLRQLLLAVRVAETHLAPFLLNECREKRERAVEREKEGRHRKRYEAICMPKASQGVHRADEERKKGG